MPTREDIIDTFETYHSYNLIRLHELCFKDCPEFLNKTNPNKLNEFVDLIMNSIDYRNFYKNIHKKYNK